MLERSVSTQEGEMCLSQINTKSECFLVIKANRILHLLYGLDQGYLVNKYLVFLL